MKGSRPEELLDTARELWPGSQPIVVRRSPSSSGTFRLVPSAKAPKWAIPTEPPSASALVSRGSAADGYLQQVGRAGLLRLLNSQGARFLFRDFLELSTATEESFEAYLGRKLGEDVRFAFPTSSPRANRKPVLEVHRRAGGVLGFVKIGISDLARTLVRHEDDVLRRLADANLETFDVPVVLHTGAWRGHEFLLVSELTGGRGRGESLTAASFAEVAKVAGLSSCNVGDSAWLDGLRARAAATPDGLGARAHRLVTAYRERWAGMVLQFGAWHGDLGAWNLAWSGGRAQVWDWERFAVGVPVGMDAVHYVGHPLVRRCDPRLARLALDERAPLAVAAVLRYTDGEPPSPELVRSVVDAYAVEVSTRFLHDAAGEHGAAVRTQALWHASVAEQRLVAGTPNGALRNRRLTR